MRRQMEEEENRSCAIWQFFYVTLLIFLDRNPLGNSLYAPAYIIPI